MSLKMKLEIAARRIGRPEAIRNQIDADEVSDLQPVYAPYKSNYGNCIRTRSYSAIELNDVTSLRYYR
jgi:hypothetical protein